MKLFFPHRFSFTALLLVCFLLQLQNVFAQAPLVKMWDKRFGGTKNDFITTIQQTHDGGFILGGYSLSGKNGDKTEKKWGGYDYWIVKIDSMGNKQWDRDFGGTDYDYLQSIDETYDGGYILGGLSRSDSGGNKTQNNWGFSDYWIIKIDSLGNLLWEKDFGGTGVDYLNSIQQTLDGGYIFGGQSDSDSSGTKTEPIYGGQDYWIIKTDNLGNKQWEKDFGGADHDELFSIHQTKDGGYILGGSSNSDSSDVKTQNSWGLWDYWVIKIDSLGVKEWDKDYGGFDDDVLLSLQITNDGGYIMGGRSKSAISGNKTQNSWGNFDYWIVKIDSIGNIQWDKDFGGTDIDGGWLYHITLTKDGGYLLCGDSYSSISGDKTEANLGQVQAWLVKIDSVGNKQWDKTIFTNGNDQHGLAIQSNDECFVIANFTDAGMGGYKTQSSQGDYDYWVVKFCDSLSVAILPNVGLLSSDTSFCEKSCINFFDLSTNNPTTWQWHFPGASPDTSTLENPTNICYNNYGTYGVSLVACNQFGCDSISFLNFITCYQNPVDSIYGANDTLWSTPAFSYQWYETTSGIISGATNQFYVPLQLGSYFCVVTDSNGCEANSNTITLTAGPLTPKGGTIQIQPNPGIDFMQVSISPFGGQGAWSLELFDVNGSIVLHQSIDDKNKIINISSLAKGVYGYRIISNEKILQQGKLVKM